MSNAYVIEASGETAGIIVREGQRFRFLSSSPRCSGVSTAITIVAPRRPRAPLARSWTCGFRASNEHAPTLKLNPGKTLSGSSRLPHRRVRLPETFSWRRVQWSLRTPAISRFLASLPVAWLPTGTAMSSMRQVKCTWSSTAAPLADSLKPSRQFTRSGYGVCTDARPTFAPRVLRRRRSCEDRAGPHVSTARYRSLSAEAVEKVGGEFDRASVGDGGDVGGCCDSFAQGGEDCRRLLCYAKHAPAMPGTVGRRALARRFRFCTMRRAGTRRRRRSGRAA